MKNTFKAFSMAKSHLIKDKINLTLSLIPVLIGIFIYSIFGTALFTKLPAWGKDIIAQYLSGEIWGEIVSYIIIFLLSILMFILVNWTFVLIVMIFASPFYDALSKRIERSLKGETLQDNESTWKDIIKNLFWTILNEIKKVSVILFLSIIAFILSYIPILTPFAFMITALLFCSQFLDYTWSRNELNSKECWRGVRKNIGSYILMGGMLFICMSIPFLNLLIPAFATSYFTILWLLNEKDSYEEI